MDKDNNDILDKIGRRDGMTTPPGYFADFAALMADKLEPTPFEESNRPKIAKPVSRWQKYRPYVYMAAMFAGVWCMMRMFTMMGFMDTNAEAGALQPSPILAQALDNEIFVNQYILDDVDQWDLMDELMDDGIDVHMLSMPAAESDQPNYMEL